MSNFARIFINSLDLVFIKRASDSLSGNYDVRSFQDSRLLLKTIKENVPDLLIIDMTTIAEKDQRIIHQVKSDPDLVFVLLIAIIENDPKFQISSQVTDIPADGYLTKPVTDHLLTAQVQAMLRLKRAEDQLRLSKARVEGILRISQYQAEDLQDFLNYALEEAIHLTNSRYGYIYHYDEKKREFTLNSWSKNVMDVCTIREPQTVYQLDQTGIWGEAVRQGRPILINDFRAPNPLKRGYPEGHAPLHNFLTVPVYRHGRIIAVVGVANKDGDFGEEEIIQLKLLMDSVWGYLERQRLQIKLEKSEEHYRLLFENSGIGITYYDLDGTLLDCNQTALDSIGGLEEDYIGKTAVSVFGDQVGGQIIERIRQTIKEAKPKGYEDQLVLTNGDRWFSSIYCVVENEKKKPIGIQVVSQDISEKKKLEQALVSQAKFPQENPNPVMRVAQDGRILYANQGSESILKKWRCKPADIVPNEILEVLRNCFLNKCDESIEVNVEGAIFSLFIVPVIEFGYVNIYGSDVTNLRHAQRELQAYSRTLEKKVEQRTKELQESQEMVFRQEKLAVLGKLSGGIAHELRNPLAIINSAAYFISDQLDENSEAKECAEIIKDEVHNADHIISTLNNFARQKQPSRSPQALGEMIKTLVSHHPPPENIHLNLKIPDNFPAINVDPQQILQAFTNLTHNAYQAMPDGGILTIAAKTNHENAEISFRDSGKGFSKEGIKNLYQPLYTSKPEGIGLGLPIVKMLIEAHEGSIELKNDPGKGAEFLVTLPLARDKK
jgi:PAS domain S-box-containing protein